MHAAKREEFGRVCPTNEKACFVYWNTLLLLGLHYKRHLTPGSRHAKAHGKGVSKYDLGEYCKHIVI